MSEDSGQTTEDRRKKVRGWEGGKVRSNQGKHLDSPEVALAKMQDEGFTHVAVQSLHTIGGSEYHDLRRPVGAFKSMGGFQRVILGYPMLSTQKDMQRTLNAILAIIPGERKKTGVNYAGFLFGKF